MPGLQELIYHWEVGAGSQVIKRVAIVLGLLVLAVFYDLREYRNFSAPEAMDAAQLARNIATGKGYTTQLIRPLSMHLLQQHRADKNSLIKDAHPDLANPPLYPVLLAGLMKVLPFQFDIRRGVAFLRYQPEVLIALFNQALFFLAVWMVFRLAKKLFEASVAWLSAVIFGGSAVFWRFSISGLSTMLLVVLFLAVVWCLVTLEHGLREEGRGTTWFAVWAVLAGILVGLGGLTRYSFGWLILPVAAFVALFFGPRRALLLPAVLVAFALVMGPWVVRNLQVSGTPFGTAGYAIYAETPGFAGDVLERSLGLDLKPEGLSEATASKLGKVETRDFVRKLLVNANQMVQNDLPRLGGSWISAFFLAGLLVPFMSPTLSRLRVFLLLCLGVLILVQALGRTHLATDSPDINSENLLALLAPLVFIYGVGMYNLLADQITLPFQELRRVIAGGFCLMMSAPLAFALLPPRTNPLVYPPYYPPLIQQLAVWMKEKELMMSDMPWAVAWYGNRSCVWTTLNVQEDFFAINDEQRLVQALYLSQVTLDKRLQTQLLAGPDREWGRFFMGMISTGQVPTGFPLRKAYADILPEGQVFLSDWERWNRPAH